LGDEGDIVVDSTPMKSTELAELLLVRLYELAKQEDRHSVHILSAIASDFGVTDKSHVSSVARMLEHRGLINATFTRETEVYASIKAEGEFLVEQGGETGILRQYAQDPKSLLVVDQSTHFHGSIAHSNIVTHSSRVTQLNSTEVQRLLDLVHTVIAEDPSLPLEAKNRAWADVDLIRTEVERQAPREGIVREALATLGDIASITSFVAQLGSALLSP